MKQTIQEYLGLPDDWPLVERVKHEIVLMPNRKDIRRAKQKDPRACALRNTACRVFDVPNAAIGGRWAYIPQRDDKGRFYIARMQATAVTQRAIRQFDETGTMPEGGFHFVPIAPCHTLKYKKDYNRKWYAGEIGHNQGKRAYKAQRILTRSLPMNFKTIVKK